MSTEIKPCPFCGNEKLLIHLSHDTNFISCFISCDRCAYYSANMRSKSQAIEAHNQVARASEIRKKLDRGYKVAWVSPDIKRPTFSLDDE
jgi:Lar family restriction alleviation protein